MSRRWRISLLVLVALIPIAGCWLASGGNSLPTTGVGSGAVGSSSVSYGRWSDGLAIAVWADTNWQYGSNGETSAGRARYSGFASTQTGERLDWSCQIVGPGRGEVFLNGVRYDLADGSLFLVSVKTGTVQQLQRDLTGVSPDLASLEALGRDDPDVRAFVATAKAPRMGRWLPDPGSNNRLSLGQTINRPLS